MIGDEEKVKTILQNRDKLKKLQMNNRKFVFDLFQQNRKLIDNTCTFNSNNKFRWNIIPENYYDDDEAEEKLTEKSYLNNKAYYMNIRRVDFFKI